MCLKNLIFTCQKPSGCSDASSTDFCCSGDQGKLILNTFSSELNHAAPYLLADEVDPGGGAVGEVGSLGVPVALGTDAHVRGDALSGGKTD